MTPEQKDKLVEPYAYELKSYHPEFHAVATISLGELYHSGWYNPEDETWSWDCYNFEQYKRLCSKFLRRYWYREIGILPPGRWKQEYIRKLNEIMPKYKLLYARLDEGLDILQVSDTYKKERDVTSAYPQTQISGEEDYASGGRDHEEETVEDGPTVDMIDDFNRKYKDVDVMVLDELEVLFSSLVSVNLNSY